MVLSDTEFNLIIIIVIYSHSKGTEWLRQLVKYSAQAL
jgi:hypothetical protein